MQHIIPAEFHGTPLSIIDRDGQKWLTSEEVGRCLGYAEANVRKGISKLYTAHADEFTVADTFVAVLATNPQGGNPNVRIFSATGCIKLGFFANTPRAKDFRAWASEVLAGKSGAVVVAPQPDPAALQLATEVGKLRDTVAAQGEVILSLFGRLDTAQRGHIRAVTSLLNLNKRHAAMDAKATMLRMLAEGRPRDEIARATGRSLNHIRQIAFRARADGTLPELPADTTGDLFGGAA